MSPLDTVNYFKPPANPGRTTGRDGKRRGRQEDAVDDTIDLNIWDNCNSIQLKTECQHVTQIKIAEAVARLEHNLPLSRNQRLLPEPLRRLHQSILRHYLENGRAPALSEIDFAGELESAIQRLVAEKLIVLGPSGAISGAYPFVDEAREFKVVSDFGAVHAMCAFDALAVSGMFALPTRIESRCRISECSILIEQNGANLQIIEPGTTVFGAIDWDARDSAQSCSASLCTAMMFIAGNDNAVTWRNKNPASRELFTLEQAHVFISAVFLPLMRCGDSSGKID